MSSTLRGRLIRLATVNAELRPLLLPILARFEEGVPADPTQNMSEEDAKTWWAEHAKHKDNFKSASFRSLYLREETAKALANRPDGAKAATLVDVFREAAHLIAGEGADDRAIDAMAKQLASDFTKKALHTRKR